MIRVHWQNSLCAAAVILVPLSVARIAWRLFTDIDRVAVVNGVLRLPESGGLTGYIELIVTALCWTWAVAAAASALTGSSRPVREAGRHLPSLTVALLCGGAVALGAVVVLGLFLPMTVELFVVLAVVAGIGSMTIIVRLAVVLPVVVAEMHPEPFRRAFELVRGRAWASGALVVLGVGLPALVVLWLGAALESVEGRIPSLIAAFVLDSALIVLAAAQAATLMAVHRRLAHPVDEPVEQVRRPAVWWAVLAALVPAVSVAGLVATVRQPRVSIVDLEYGRLMSVAWPEGRYPVIVGQDSFLDCLDAECRGVRRTDLSVIMFDPSGGVVVAADGSVLALGQHELERCDPQRVCTNSDGRLEILKDSRAEAIALTPGGEILIATATPVEDGDPDRPLVELGLVYCAEVSCAESRTVVLGVVDGSLEDRTERWLKRTLSVGTGSNGRPVVMFTTPSDGTIKVGWCVTAACDEVGVAWHGNPPAPGMPTPEELADLHFQSIFDDSVAATAGAPHGGLYRVITEKFRPDGISLRFGEVQPRTRAVLVHCADHGCREARRIPILEQPLWQTMWSGRQPNEIWMIAATPDGRVLMAQPVGSKKIITVSL